MLIRTVTGHGYQFAGDIRVQSTTWDAPNDPASVVIEPAPDRPSTNLPEQVSELIGRDDIREIISLATSHRLVTLTGPGGIGKTRLALAAAHKLLAEFPDGVWLAEFSPLSDPSLVPTTVAAAAGLELPPGEISARRVAQALAGRRMLLVLDTCEHVIDAAAELAEALLRTASGVRIFATSREALRAEGSKSAPCRRLPFPTPKVRIRGNAARFNCSPLARAEAARTCRTIGPSCR